MSDVFISYAREDVAVAHDLAESFTALGWSVWWDRTLLAGEEFRSTIQRELMRAHAVVVVWSTNSVESRWVLDEARVAYERGIVVPVLLDGAQIPLGFGQLHTVHLSSSEADGRREVVEAVHRLIPDVSDRDRAANEFRAVPDPPRAAVRSDLAPIVAALTMAPLVALGFALVVRSGHEYVNSLGYFFLAMAAFVAARLAGGDDPWRRATRAVLEASVVVMLLWSFYWIWRWPKGSDFQMFENVVTLTGVWLLTIMVLPCNVRHRNQLRVAALFAMLLGGLMIRVFFRVQIDWAGVVVAGLSPIVLVVAAWSVEEHAGFEPAGR